MDHPLTPAAPTPALVPVEPGGPVPRELADEIKRVEGDQEFNGLADELMVQHAETLERLAK